MARALYVDTSAVLRAVLETGTTPEVEAAIAATDVLVVSRLAIVESARALIRAVELTRINESQHAALERELEQLWDRCAIWELSRTICNRACAVAPRSGLRTLDALHLATFLEARRRLGELDLLTTDDRLRQAAGIA